MKVGAKTRAEVSNKAEVSTKAADDDLSSPLRKQRCLGFAHAVRCAGDDRNLVPETH